MRTVMGLLILTLALTGQSFAVDKDTAVAYATSAAKLSGDGKLDQAKNLCYAALAQDEECADALYELGKIFEKEGKVVAAGDFLVRAARLYGKEEADKPALSSKRVDAETRVKRLNEFAARLTAVMTDYTQELNTITQKNPDKLTLDEASDRADSLNLKSIVPPGKGPKFEREVTVVPEKKKTPVGPMSRSSNRIPSDEEPEIQTVVSPDVERVLKNNGWTKITGQWKKKAENVYEVTDGKLEADKTNGAVQVLVHKASAGTVRCLVRNNFPAYESSTYYATGYGFMIKGGTAKLYTPEAMSLNENGPYFERDIQLPAANPKNLFLITIAESRMEFFVNGKRERLTTYKIPKEGPLVVEIKGTATIELPAAKGQ